MTRDRSKDIEFFDMPWPIAILAALSACLVLSVCGARFVYKLYRAPSASMMPAVVPGDYMVVDKFAYARGRPIQRGDLIVFRPEPYPDQDFLKRVVALGGDTVQVIDGRVVVNGVTITAAPSSNRMVDEGGGDAKRVEVSRETPKDAAAYEVFSVGVTEGDDTEIYDVPENTVFVLGDNRDNSADSRFEMGGFGFVERRSVTGKVVRVMPRHTALPIVLDALRPF